jgi:spore maturation protein CgeB
MKSLIAVLMSEGVDVKAFSLESARAVPPAEFAAHAIKTGVSKWITVGCELAGPMGADILFALEKRGIPVRWWLVDEPRTFSWSVRITPRISRCFSHSSDTVLKHRMAGARIDLLPLGVHMPEWDWEDSEPAEIEWDLCFLGRINHPQREWMASQLPKSLRCCFSRQVFDKRRIQRIYRSSQIVLNPLGWCDWPQVSSGVNLRTFEIAACGAFQLAADRVDMGHCFKPGSEIATYRGQKDLLDQIVLWLDRADARERIATAARRKCLIQHQMSARAESLSNG